jgi:mannose-6-phosphate isomerase-like protein (cupin superfamily)
MQDERDNSRSSSSNLPLAQRREITLKPTHRRTVLRTILALPLLDTSFSFADVEKPARGGIKVPTDQDRFGQRRKVFGSLPIDVKFSGADTAGNLLLIEQIDDKKGGPPRHVHHRQDEWFYVVHGVYVIEVGEERFELESGDSVLAPRGIPHVWAHMGDSIGRLLIGFQPAGEMEAFFAASTKLDGIPAGPDLARLFSEHGMELLGPPLPTG